MNKRSPLLLSVLIGGQVLGQSLDWDWTTPFLNEAIAVDHGQNGECYAVNPSADLIRLDLDLGWLDWQIEVDTMSSQVRHMRVHPNGNVLLVSAYQEVLLAALDPSGQVLWATSWADTVSGQMETVGLEFDPNGNILVAGTSANNGRQFLLQFSAGGNLLWHRAYDHMTVWGETCTGFAVDQQGNTLLVGQRGLSNNFREWTLLCYDDQGTLLWNDTYARNPPNYNEDARVRSDGLGHWYVCGITENPGAQDNDMTLRKYTTGGSVLWTRHVHQANETEMVDLEMDPNGDVVAACHVAAIPGHSSTCLISKVTPSNDLLWTHYIPALQSSSVIATDLEVDAAGNIYLSYKPSSLNIDAGIDSYDPDGDLLWTHYYPSQGSFGSQYVNAITIDPFGGILATGGEGSGMFTYRLCTDPIAICTEPQQLFATINGEDLAAIDLDLDGLDDVVVTAFSDSLLVVHMNLGASFGPADTIALPFVPLEPQVADMDMDGDEDLWVRSSTGSSWILFRNMGGSLVPDPIQTQAPPIVRSLVTDLDGNGAADIVYTSFGSAQVSVLMNNGNATFSGSFLTLPMGTAASVTTGDADLDGTLDVIVGAFSDANAYVFPGNGNGTFQPPFPIASGTPFNSYVGFGDTDNDGTPDLVTARASFTAHVSRGLGQGVYDAPITVNHGSSGINDLHVTPFPGTPEVGFTISDNNGAWSFGYSPCSGQFFPYTIYQEGQSEHMTFGNFDLGQSVDVLGVTFTNELVLVLNCDTSTVISTALADPRPAEPATIKVWPNPANDVVQVGAPSGTIDRIRLWRVDGAQVRDLRASGRTVFVHVEDLPPGLYFLEARTGDDVHVSRLVISR